MKQVTKQRYIPPMLEALRLNQLPLLARVSVESLEFENLNPYETEWQDM